jgi:HlyD family secretion protein
MTDTATPPPPSYDPSANDDHQKRRYGWRYLAGGALLGLIVFGLWPTPQPVEVATVTRGTLVVTVEEEGVTQVRHRYVISSPVSGQLRRIELKPGADVIAGQTIVAVLEPASGDILDASSQAQAEAHVRAAESQVAQAEAERQRAAATLELARTEAARQRVLARDKLVSQQEIDVAENRELTATQEDRASTFSLQVARYELERAQAVLQRAQPGAPADASLLRIASPVGGKVLRVFQESSRVVTGGLALLEVGDPTDLEVRIEVLSRDGVAIQPGARVWLDQWGGESSLDAKVRLVEPAAFTKISALGVEEQRVNVLADLVSPPAERQSLGDGFRVEARIERARGEDTLIVPAGALFQRDHTWLTFVVDRGSARLREVSVGLSNGIITEVTTGLEAGDSVIVYPGDKISDDSRVRPVTE